jgi:hypothetical protein
MPSRAGRSLAAVWTAISARWSGFDSDEETATSVDTGGGPSGPPFWCSNHDRGFESPLSA